MSEDNYEFTMITAKGCSPCASAKEKLKDKIESGKIKVLDVMESDEALELAMKHKITGTPSFIIKNKATKSEEVCMLSSDLKKVLCPDDKEVDL